MYDFNYIVDYKEKDEPLQDETYRENICKTFYMDTYDDYTVKSVTNYVFIFINNNEFFDKIKKLIYLKHNFQDSEYLDDQLFMTLFSFDYYDIFHKCLQCQNIHSFIHEDLKKEFLERLT